MTTLEAIDKLDLLLDKYGSPYFTQTEKLNFLNMAQLEALNRMIPDSVGGVVNFDLDRNTLTNINQLIYHFSISPDQTTADGVRIFYSSLLTQVRSQSGQPSATINRIMNLSVITSLNPYIEEPIKYIQQNKIAATTVNTFKRPTSTNRVYYLEGSNIRCVPTITSQVKVILIKDPVIMTAAVNPEWGDYMMNQIISIAAQMASIGLRDPELLQQLQNSNIAK